MADPKTRTYYAVQWLLGTCGHRHRTLEGAERCRQRLSLSRFRTVYKITESLSRGYRTIGNEKCSSST